MNNPLSQKISALSLIKFTLPTIIMMIFMSIYTMVDGIFVARFVNTNALSAINIVYPLLNIVLGLGLMLATGGSASIAKLMGENKSEDARRNFTLLVIFCVSIGLVVGTFCTFFIKPLMNLLGANEVILQYCSDYAGVLFLFFPSTMLQILFQYLFITAGKPHLGLITTLIGGITNIVLDYIFIAILNMGIGGAALATGIGFSIPAVFGLCYFSLKRTGSLFFVKPKWAPAFLLKSCSNGSSEMIGNLAVAITTFLFNTVMMRYYGENGVAAITIIFYAEFIFNALFLGYASGVAPIISFNYGEGNHDQLRKIFRLSMIFIGIASSSICAISYLIGGSVIQVFAKEGTAVYDLALNGFYLFAPAFLFMGTNVFGSALFTAFSNGKISLFLSFARTFVLLTSSILLLPTLIGENGIWLAVPLAESMAVLLTLTCYKIFHKHYHFA